MELFKTKYIFTIICLLWFSSVLYFVSVYYLKSPKWFKPSDLFHCSLSLGRWARVMDKTSWWPGNSGPCFNTEIVEAIQKVTKVFFIAKIYEKKLSVCVLRIKLVILVSCHWETVTFLPVDFLFFPPLRILLDLPDFVCASLFIAGEGKLIPTELQSLLPSGIYRISL